jgi:UDP-N-acetylglucosamine enolpyruvyl transferase
LQPCARAIRGADLDPELCARICASILLAGPLLARTGHAGPAAGAACALPPRVAREQSTCRMVTAPTVVNEHGG